VRPLHCAVRHRLERPTVNRRHQVAAADEWFGKGRRRVGERDDAELASLAAADLAVATGVRGKPTATRVTRWGGSLPQYTVGHLNRVRRIRAAAAAQPGLAVCGAAYDGIGIPACIASARMAADQVLAYLAGRTVAQRAPAAGE